MKHIFSILALGIMLFSCDVDEFDYSPGTPAEDVERPTTSTATYQSNLLLENGNDFKNIDSDDEETNLAGSDLAVVDFFSNPGFGLEGSRELLPRLKYNAIDGLGLITSLPSPMTTPTFVGAFGENDADNVDWHVNSEWFLMDPASKEYSYNANTVSVISGSITSDITLTADKHYLLEGQVFVQDGATVTIEPGTVIFGSGRTGSAEPGVLVINRGAKIDAQGTPGKPIVFTSTKDIGARDRGDWGGIVLLGKSPNNKGENVTIEGIDATGNNGQYGGNEPNDNSGILKYVRIEFAGIALSAGNEINSLTMGSVGDATEIHHIIVSYAGDDSYEWFGGNVDVHHVASYNTLDDDLDNDAGFQGTVQYAYLLRNEFNADISASKCIESTSSKSEGAIPQTNVTFSNITMVGPLYTQGEGGVSDPQFQNGVMASRFSDIKLFNSVVIGCPIGVQND